MAHRVAFLRLREDIKTCRVEGKVWLRGFSLTGSLELDLKKVPGAVRYRVLANDELLQDGTRIPRGRLPSGSWRPLKSCIVPRMPRAAFPGSISGKTTPHLIRSGKEREARVLLTTLTCWARFAEKAAEVRLHGLLFAGSPEGVVVIRAGNPTVPLPSLPGLRLVEEAGVAWPCGTAWDPPVGADVLSDLLQIAEGDLALCSEEGTFELVPAAHFVAATRAAVRSSREAFGHE